MPLIRSGAKVRFMVAARNWCSRTYSDWPCGMVSGKTWPEASREKAISPYPTAWVIMIGMPAMTRLKAPGMRIS